MRASSSAAAPFVLVLESPFFTFDSSFRVAGRARTSAANTKAPRFDPAHRSKPPASFAALEKASANPSVPACNNESSVRCATSSSRTGGGIDESATPQSPVASAAAATSPAELSSSSLFSKKAPRASSEESSESESSSSSSSLLLLPPPFSVRDLAGTYDAPSPL